MKHSHQPADHASTKTASIRTAGYMAFVSTYLNEVMRRVEPFLRGNGGPVIMVQVAI